MITFLASGSNPMVHVLPQNLFKVGGVWVTNHMLMATVAGVLMLLIFPVLFRRTASDVPTGAKNFFESILEFLRVEVFRPALKEHTDRFVPFLWTMFFFILFCNLLGTVPFGAVFGLIASTLGMGREVAYKASEYYGTATANLNTTGALAVCAFIFIHLNGIVQVAQDLVHGAYGHHGHHKEHSDSGEPPHEAPMDLPHMRGEALPADVPQQFKAVDDPTHHYGDDEYRPHLPHGQTETAAHGGMNIAAAALLAVPLYFWNFAPHPFKPQPGESKIGWVMDVPMWLVLLVLELIGAMIKPFALCIRLFANMIAGHLVLGVLFGLIVAIPTIVGQIGVGIPMGLLILLISILELFVAFLQAYIFTFLTTLFVASAVAPEH